jgi:predicted DNA-binding transcriptional regulator AlpA
MVTVEIVAAHTAGVKVPVIAEATGLTRQRIYQIVKEREES